MNDDKDFSNQPKSITEIKANKNSDGTLWIPRDALIHLLRLIDSGEEKIDMIIIGYAKIVVENGVTYGQTDYVNCSPSSIHVWGLWSRVNYLLHDNKSITDR